MNDPLNLSLTIFYEEELLTTIERIYCGMEHLMKRLKPISQDIIFQENSPKHLCTT